MIACALHNGLVDHQVVSLCSQTCTLIEQHSSNPVFRGLSTIEAKSKGGN